MLAALSLVLPWDLSYDPWGWLVWGREITDPQLHLNTVFYPSWKPLPVVFTSVFSLLGSAAPTLWLVTARAGALLAVVLAYRLAARLGGVVAGLVAAAGLLLLGGWLRYFSGGASEPLLVALVLGAILRHLDGHRGQALGLGFAAALLRPEAWPFLFLYAALYARGGWRQALVAGTLLALVPVLWLVPEWAGSGDLFHGAHLAKTSKEALQARRVASPELAAVGRGLGLLPIPLLAAAAFALIRAARRRLSMPLWVAAGAAGWMAVVVAMTALGYAGIARFELPAAALLCVLAGIGAAWMVEATGEGIPRALALAAIALVCVPFAYARAEAGSDSAPGTTARDALQDELPGMIDSLGGRAAVLACKPGIDSPFRTPLAWHLAVSPAQVSQLPARLVFRARRRVLTGFEGKVHLHHVRIARPARQVLRAGGWDVLATTGCGERPKVTRGHAGSRRNSIRPRRAHRDDVGGLSRRSGLAVGLPGRGAAPALVALPHRERAALPVGVGAGRLRRGGGLDPSRGQRADRGGGAAGGAAPARPRRQPLSGRDRAGRAV